LTAGREPRGAAAIGACAPASRIASRIVSVSVLLERRLAVVLPILFLLSRTLPVFWPQLSPSAASGA